MKKKNMKQVLAAMMSAAMVMSLPMVALADPVEEENPEEVVTEDDGVSVNAPIYSFDIVDVVVPSKLVVAFNPDKLSVKTGTEEADISTDQVLSQNFGILNKSNKDKIVTVTLNVEDQNDGKITFVATENEATKAAEGEYAVYLAAVPAGATEVKVGGNSAGTTTDNDAMADVDMTASTTEKVVLEEGNNTFAFILGKATYTAKTGSEITLGTTTANGVTSNLELTGVAAGGKGITAFTFTGALNTKTDWSKLASGIKITATYDFQTTYDYDTLTAADGGSVVSGTGAMLDGVAPKFTTGGVGVINYTAGLGDKAFASLVSIAAPWESSPYDLMPYISVDADAGTITVLRTKLGGWAGKGENPTATIVYKNVADEEVTVTVTLQTH